MKYILGSFFLLTIKAYCFPIHLPQQEIGYVKAADSDLIFGDGVTDDGPGIQKLLDDPSIRTIHFEESYTFAVDVTKSLQIPSNKTLIIDGEILILEKNYDYSYHALFSSDSTENIRIIGKGSINGNGKSLQRRDRGYFRLIYFTSTKNVELSVKNIGHNTSRKIASPKNSFCAIEFIESHNVKIHDITVTDWIYEGICVDSSTGAILNNIDMFATELAWSGIQIGGGGSHTVTNCYVENSGASGIGMDTENSIVSNCRVINNRNYNGFNFGHDPGDAAVNCLIINCVAQTNIESKRDNYRGFNFNATSKNNTVIDSKAIGYHGKGAAGFSVSTGSVHFINIIADSCSIGLRSYNTKVNVDKADFSASTSMPIFNVGNSSELLFKKVKQ